VVVVGEVEVRERVVGIWNEVLGVGPGQEGLTFFELRGQSISAVQLVTRVEEELGVWVDVGELFEDPDVEAFVGGVVARLGSAVGQGR
jgi:peptidyl carrier protein